MAAETAEKMAEYVRVNAYVAPPADMESPKGCMLGEPECHALCDRFDAHTNGWHDALLIYLSKRFEEPISAAYWKTDSFAKSRLGIRGFN